MERKQKDSMNDCREKCTDKTKVSIGRSLSMRWSNYRNRGKVVDKRGQLTANPPNMALPLTTSVSLDTVHRLQDSSNGDSGTSEMNNLNRPHSSKPCAIHSCGGGTKTRPKVKSLDKLHCAYLGNCPKCLAHWRNIDPRMQLFEIRSSSAPPLKTVTTGGGSGRGVLTWEMSSASELPPPLQPVRVRQPMPQQSQHQCEDIYASRQEWLTMAKAHRSSLREKLQEEFLSCKICLEPFQRPKALPCLHSFCQHCLQDYVRRHTGLSPGYFPCPMCRKDIRIPDGGIEQFQDNFVLLSLSDRLEEEEDDNDVDVWQDPHRHQLSPPRTLAPPTPLETKLREFEWYFGKVSRNASEEWLLSTGYPKGSFLVRQGEASPDTLTLSVRDCDELRGYLVKHYKIYAKYMGSPLQELFYITPKRMFKSLPDLVSHYTESADGLCCKLTQVCGKPRSLTWAHEREKEDEYSTSRETVLLVKRIGSGQFADVWLGKWSHQEVAVKIQRPDTVKMAAFLDEAQILKTLDHPNILSLLAVCSMKEPVYLVTEYMLNGRLSLYLREGQGNELKITQLLWICAQVADALAYMEKEKFIHRNLGARNILVGEKNKVKVAGFGMTKFADDPDFNFRRGLKMAIKWMAPEVLLYNKYSTKADVWSFGVLMMEVLTYGKEPYEDMGSKEAFENVQQGYRMPRPDMCPSEIYDVILTCWSNNPPSRPSFDFLNTLLHDWQSPS